MTNPADKAIEQAKKDAEDAQTTAASEAANPAKPPVTLSSAPVAKVAAPVPKPGPISTAKPKQSIVQIKFNEGIRDVEVQILQDQNTMTPRKIEHATYVLMKMFRTHLGQLQAKAAREQRALELKQADAAK
jgi:hypothetical protein